MLRAIREVQPRWVVGENVRGLTNWNGGLVFDEVQSDLEAEGYEVLPFLLPACAVNAPHRRDRIWFVAYRYSSSKGSPGTCGSIEGDRGINDDEQESGREQAKQHTGCSDVLRATPNTAKQGCENREQDGGCKNTKEVRTGVEFEFERLGSKPVITNPNGGRQPGKEHRQAQPGWIAKEGISDNWQNFPTQPPVCSGDDGLPSRLAGITFSKHRNRSIKGYGNAIVPQVVLQIFKAIEAYETNPQ